MADGRPAAGSEPDQPNDTEGEDAVAAGTDGDAAGSGMVWRAGSERVVTEEHPHELAGHDVYGPEAVRVHPAEDLLAGRTGAPVRRRTADDQGMYLAEDEDPDRRDHPPPEPDSEPVAGPQRSDGGS